MKKVGCERRYGAGRFTTAEHAHRLNEHLVYLHSLELVTPFRLLIVLLGSCLLVLLISVSVDDEDFLYARDENILPVNLAKQPYRMDYKAISEARQEMLMHYGYSLPGNKVEKRSKLPLQEFWDLYDGKWPVIVTDIVPEWKAYKTWSKEMFFERYADDKIVLKAVCQGELRDGVGHIRDMKTFLDLLEEPIGPYSWTYMEDEMFMQLRKELKEDIGDNLLTEENFFNLFPMEVRPWDSMMLWGTKYSRSTLHMDPYNWTAVSAVIWGRKKWKLFPPGQDQYLYIESGRYCGFPLECKKYDSAVDAFDVDYWMFPKFQKAEYIEVEQYSGEMLIIPSGWYHQAYNDEETLSVSMELMNRNNYLVILEEIIRGKSLSRKKLPAHFNTLLPPDQVKLLLSLLPKKVLQLGKEVTDSILESLDRRGKNSANNTSGGGVYHEEPQNDLNENVDSFEEEYSDLIKDLGTNEVPQSENLDGHEEEYNDLIKDLWKNEKPQNDISENVYSNEEHYSDLIKELEQNEEQQCDLSKNIKEKCNLREDNVKNPEED